MTFDPFALEEGGGGIEAFTGPIIEAYYQENQYGVSLMVKSMFDRPELFPDKEDGTYTQFFPAGKGWKLTGDDTVRHESGDEGKNFRKDSGVGRLISALGNIEGVRDHLPGDFDSRRGSSFKGLHLEWKRLPITKRKPKVDEDGNRVTDAQGKEIWYEAEDTMMLPAAFVTGDGSTNGAGELDVTSLGVDSGTLIALSELAKTTATDKFMVEVATKYGAHKELVAAVSKDTAGVQKALADAVI